jgi:peroxin-19
MASSEKSIPVASGDNATSTTHAMPTAHAPEVNDDSDPDFDDLDGKSSLLLLSILTDIDVLDQFSANTPVTSQKAEPAPSVPAASGPGRPATKPDPPVPSGPQPDENEEEFIARLTSEMSTMLSSLGSDPSASLQSPEDVAKMGKELEEFTTKMEKEGIQPEDLLKAILGSEEGSKVAEMAHEAKSSKPESSTDKGSTTFEDTIRRTMSRLETSNTEATNATAKSATKSEEDMLAEMLKAMEAGGSDDDSGLSKMFLDMMQQLTHKDMLYEPMKELHVQYPAWLESNKTKLPSEEYERYKRQSVIVRDIVKKFEEPGFSDDDAQCREYVWEKMQSMQSEGAPPEELVKNPFPGTDFGGIPGMGGGGGGPEEGCPTQ